MTKFGVGVVIYMGSGQIWGGWGWLYREWLLDRGGLTFSPLRACAEIDRVVTGEAKQNGNFVKC